MLHFSNERDLAVSPYEGRISLADAYDAYVATEQNLHSLLHLEQDKLEGAVTTTDVSISYLRLPQPRIRPILKSGFS